MIGYMPNLEGIGENEPSGRIFILEDIDRDGVIDHQDLAPPLKGSEYMDGSMKRLTSIILYGVGPIHVDGKL